MVEVVDNIDGWLNLQVEANRAVSLPFFEKEVAKRFRPHKKAKYRRRNEMAT